MNKNCLFTVMWFLLICCVSTCLAETGFETVISGIANDMVSSSMSKVQVDKISSTMTKAADVYNSAKSSAIETQRLLSGTATVETSQAKQTQNTRETQTTAKRSKILDVLKKIETAFLDATLNSNNHQ